MASQPDSSSSNTVNATCSCSHPQQRQGNCLSTSDSEDSNVSDPTVSSSTLESLSSLDSVVVEDNSCSRRLSYNEGTSDTSTSRHDQCKYCEIRLSLLQKIDQNKHFKEHTGKHEERKEDSLLSCGERKDAVSQTPASLLEERDLSRDIESSYKYKMMSQLRSARLCKCVVRTTNSECDCDEIKDDKYFEWMWDGEHSSQASTLQEGGRQVIFHKDYSCGTSAVRGQQVMDKDQHFWEIKMNTPVYGTDMMVGVGTRNVALNAYHHIFCSMLGHDVESWGLSYDGRVQHGGEKRAFCSRFGQGTTIGMHLDMWHGTLTYFKNRQSLGVAFTGLRGRQLYPMACSTAARSGMRITCARSFPTSLQYLCCRQLRQFVPSHLSVLDALTMPPGLRLFLANNMTWLLDVPHGTEEALEFVCSTCLPLKKVFEGCSVPMGERRSTEELRHLLLRHASDHDEDSDAKDGTADRWLEHVLEESTPSTSSESRESEVPRNHSHSLQMFSRVLSSEHPVVKKSRRDSGPETVVELEGSTSRDSDILDEVKETCPEEEIKTASYKGLGKRKKTE